MSLRRADRRVVRFQRADGFMGSFVLAPTACIRKIINIVTYQNVWNAIVCPSLSSTSSQSFSCRCCCRLLLLLLLLLLFEDKCLTFWDTGRVKATPLHVLHTCSLLILPYRRNSLNASRVQPPLKTQWSRIAGFEL